MKPYVECLIILACGIPMVALAYWIAVALNVNMLSAALIGGGMGTIGVMVAHLLMNYLDNR